MKKKETIVFEVQEDREITSQEVNSLAFNLFQMWKREFEEEIPQYGRKADHDNARKVED